MLFSRLLLLFGFAPAFFSQTLKHYFLNINDPGGCPTKDNGVLNIAIDIPVPTSATGLQIRQVVYGIVANSFTQPTTFKVSGGGKSASLNAQTSAKYCCAANGCDIRFAPGFSSWYEAPNCGKPSGCSPTLQWHMISFDNTAIGTCNGCGIPGSGSISLDISFGGAPIFVPDFGAGTTVYVSYYAITPVILSPSLGITSATSSGSSSASSSESVLSIATNGALKSYSSTASSSSSSTDSAVSIATNRAFNSSSSTASSSASSRETAAAAGSKRPVVSATSSASSSGSPSVSSRETAAPVPSVAAVISATSSASSSASSRETAAPVPSVVALASVAAVASNKQVVSEFSSATSSVSSSASSKKSALPVGSRRQVASKTGSASASAYSRESPLSVASAAALASGAALATNGQLPSVTSIQSASSYDSYSSTSRITGLPRSTSVPTPSKLPQTRPTYTSTDSKESYMIESASAFASRMEIPTISYYSAFSSAPKNSSTFLQTTNYSDMSLNPLNLLNTFVNSTSAYSSSDSATQTSTILSGTAIGASGLVMLAALYKYLTGRSAFPKKEASGENGPDSEKGEAGGFAPTEVKSQVAPPTLFSYGMNLIKSPSKLLNLVKNPKQAFSELQTATMQTIAPVNKDLTKVKVIQEAPKKITTCSVCAKKLIEQKKAAVQKKVLSVKPKPGTVEKRKPAARSAPPSASPGEPEPKVPTSAASVISEDNADSILNATVYRDLDDDDIKENDVGDSVSEHDVSLELPNTVHEAEEEQDQVQGSTALVEIQKEDMEQVLAYLQEMKKRHTVIE